MKKSEIKIAALFGEIAKKCYIISTQSKADVFFRYAPHCNDYYIFVHKQGWQNGANGEEIDFCKSITVSNLNNTIKKLDNLSAELGIKNAQV